jgi:hypothetical protein
MRSIERVEIYFEPLGTVKMMMQSGAQVTIPLHRGIPAAIKTADQFLGLGGDLIAFSSGKDLDVHVVEKMSDAEWADHLNGRAQGTRWKRWNGETTQGRWNAVVYLGQLD